MEFFNLNYLRNNLSELHIHTTIQDFALCLVSVFFPIFFLSIGFSLNQVFLYYIVYFFSFGSFCFLAPFAARIGFRKIIMLRPVALIISLLWTYSLEFFPSTFFLLPVYNGLVASFYWIIFHYFFAKKVDGGDAEKKVGFLFGFPKIFSLFSPLFGAVIIYYFSFNVLFIIVCFLLFASIIPLFGLKDYKLSSDFDYKKLFDKSFIKYFFGFIADGVSYVVTVILLPLYIYLIFSQALEVGFFSTLLGLGSLLTPILVAYACKGRTSKFIKFGAVLSGLVLCIVFFIHTQIEFFFLGFLIGTFNSIWNVPFYARLYNHAEKVDTLEFLVMRESIMNYSRVLIFILMFFFSDFNIAFFAGIISYLLLLGF